MSGVGVSVPCTTPSGRLVPQQRLQVNRAPSRATPLPRSDDDADTRQYHERLLRPMRVVGSLLPAITGDFMAIGALGAEQPKGAPDSDGQTPSHVLPRLTAGHQVSHASRRWRRG